MQPVFIKSFGCKVNYAECASFGEQAREAGFAPVVLTSARLPDEAVNHQDDQPATRQVLVFVNSCCVTREAERKVVQFVRRVKRDYPEAEVLFSGCCARLPRLKEKYAEAGARLFEFPLEALAWLRRELVAAVAGQSRMPWALEDGVGTREEPTTSCDGKTAPPGRARAFVKAQDGCLSRCTYCIVPLVRPFASRPLAQVRQEVEEHVAAGCREVVVTGINLGKYGMGPASNVPETKLDASPRSGSKYAPVEGQPSLSDLLDEVLARLPAGRRLRVSSIEPEDITQRFLRQLAHPQMCPHLHLPLQSGSDAVLRAMGRNYTVAQYSELAMSFRRGCSGGALTTDILVGFPGETERDFQQTLDLCSELGFERIHGFPYSPRPGTEAASLPRLPRRVIHERNRRLLAHCGMIADRRWSRFVGRTAQVLIEEHGDEGWQGHGEAYQVVRGEDDAQPGQICDVRLTAYARGEFKGQVLT